MYLHDIPGSSSGGSRPAFGGIYYLVEKGNRYMQDNQDNNDVPNLKALFGDKYRVTWEQDGMNAHRSSNPDTVWRMRIVGKKGEVYPYGPGKIGVMTGNCHTARRLGKPIKPGEETAIIVDLSLAETVFDLIKPRRVRKLSEQSRAESTQRLALARKNQSQKSGGFRP